MTAILLRVAGLNAFDRDSQPQPPYRKLAQTEECMGTRKRDAIIGANSCGNAKLFKNMLKHVQSRKYLNISGTSPLFPRFPANKRESHLIKTR